MAGADRRVGLFLLALLLLSAGLPAAAAGDASAGHRASIAPAQVDADDVLLAVNLHADGDATWRVAYRVRLDDQNTTEAFEQVQQDLEQNPENHTNQFRDRMVRTAQSAENATGREMSIQNVTVSAEKKQLPREYGVISYRFTWTNFAEVDGSQLRVGDALRGLFLDSETTLLFTWPAEYRVDSVTPGEPAERGENKVAWSGSLEFGDDEPGLVLTSAPATTATATTTAPPGDGRDLALVPMLAVGAALALGAVGFFATRNRFGDSGDEPEPVVDADTTEAADGGGTTTDATETPEELMSNEEQVLRLVEEHGGRIKQQQIVQELDWTEAKTSQVVGELRDEDEIETFRIGRENVVTLPDEAL